MAWCLAVPLVVVGTPALAAPDSGPTGAAALVLVVAAATTLVLLVVGGILLRRTLGLLGLARPVLERLAGGSDGDGLAAAAVVRPPREVAGMLARLDSAQRLNARQFQLQRTQFELFKRMRGDQEPRPLAAAILEFAGEYYDAPVGAFYLARPGHRLELVASFGIADASVRSELRLGQGVVGRAAGRRRILVLNDLDADHLRLETGLGTSAPRAVIVAPFHFAGQLMGVMELGVAATVDEDDLDFLKLSAESVAMALDSARARARVHRLLEETRRQAAVLSRQQAELQATNEQLERADRYKSEFLANMSHELRTPLNSMLIMSQVLAENRAGNLTREDVESALTINKAGHELLMIINDILDMSRVEAGKLELQREHVDPRLLVRSLEDLFRPVARRRGLELVVETDRAAPTGLVTDQLRTSQILKNLLNNACKFTERGRVTLRLRAAAGADDGQPWLAIEVSDTGAGMDEETLARVFEAFCQGDGSIGRRYGGSGLGLAISRSLAELLGGRIEVTSAVGLGSTFTLLLPCTPPSVAAANPATAFAPAPVSAPVVPAVDADAPGRSGLLAGCTVLLVDGDMRAVYGISDLLDRMSARVVIARSAADGREMLARHDRIDLVLADRRLWDADTDPVSDRAGSRPGVILLGDGDATSPAVGSAPVIEKTVTADRLAEVCCRLLAERGASVP